MRDVFYCAFAFGLAFSLAIGVVAFCVSAIEVPSDVTWRDKNANAASAVPRYDPVNPCGVTAVCVISHLLQRPVGLKEASNVVRPDPLGRNSLAELELGLTSLGFSTLGVRLGWRDIANTDCPVILHLKEEHFVVGVRFANNQLVVIDPPERPSLKRRRELASWTGAALLVTCTDQEMAQVAQRIGITPLW